MTSPENMDGFKGGMGDLYRNLNSEANASEFPESLGKRREKVAYKQINLEMMNDYPHVEG